MNLCKRILIITCLFLMSTGICFSQPSQSNLSEEERSVIKENMESLATALQLTDEQKTKFISISKKYGNQILALKDSEASRMSKYLEYRSLSSARNEEMEQILTPNQYELYLEKQEEMKEQMQDRSDR